MSVVEIALTAEQLASAYLQLSEQERRCFLESIFSHPANTTSLVVWYIYSYKYLSRIPP
jgi:hypothetical protein